MKTRNISRIFSLLLALMVLLGILPLGAAVQADDYAYTFDLTIAGTVVTLYNAKDVLGDGVFSYDYINNRLHVNGDSSDGFYAIESHIEGLTISVDGNSYLSSVSSAIRLYADTTIRGNGSLQLSAPNAAILVSDGAELTIEEAFIDAYAAIVGNRTGESLQIIDSSVNARGTSGAVQGFDGGITLEKCSVTSADCVVRDGAIYENDNVNLAIDLTIRAEQYRLNVAGVAVTGENADDILGNGVFSYDPPTRTLTVSGDFTLEGGSPIIDNQDVRGLTIYVAEDSTLTRTGYGTCIRLDEDTVITGPGRLTVNSDNTAISVWVSYDLEIRNTELVANGKTGGISHFDSTASWVGRLIIRDSDVTVTSGRDTLYDFRGGIELYDCEIVTPTDYKIIKGTVFQADGVTQPKKIEIRSSLSGTYNLWVAGTQVTKQNRRNILAGTAGDGVFSYDPDTNTLTVSGDSSADDCAIESRMEGLTIDVIRDSTLSAHSSAIRLYADTSITGPGKLTLSAGSVGLYVRSGAELTLQNANLSVKGKWGIAGDTDGESLKVVDSVVRAQGASGAICDFDGGIKLRNSSQILSPTGAVVGASVFLNDGTTLATEVLIAEPYELTILGTPATSANAADILGDGVFSYDASANTLTIKGDFTGAGTVIKSETWGLTITATGNYTVRSEEQTALQLFADTTITGPGKLLTFSGSLSGMGISVYDMAELTIQDADVKATGYWGIAGDAGSLEFLRVLNSNVTAMGSAAAIGDFGGGITLEGCAITDPAEGMIQNGAVCAKNGTTPANFVKINAAEQYGLTIAGTAVTRANASDILGNGVFSYNVYTNTLTINGDYTTDRSNVISSKSDGLTIEVTGDSVLTAPDAAIRLLADTIITGPGKLTLLVSANNYGAIYVTDGAELTIRDAKIDASYTGARGIGAILGDSTGESLRIIRSDVNAKASDHAIFGFTGGITLENCTITSPQRAVIREGCIQRSDSTAALEVTIQALWEYDLAIAQRTVTSYNADDILGDGVFSYDASTNTLTVRGDCTASGGNGLVIENRIKGLTIRVARDSVLRSEEKYAIRLYADTTITGRRMLTVSAPVVGIYVSTGAALTVKDTDIRTSGKYGIAGDKGGESLLVSNSNLVAQGATAAIADLTGGITLEECSLLSPFGGMIRNGAICEAESEKAATDVVIQEKQTSGYDLIVAGTTVNEVNAADILGDGVFSYSISANILIVNGDCTGSDCAIESRTDGLTIFVTGDSALEGQEAALRLYADTTILGQSKLSLFSSTAAIYVSSGASLTVQDMTLSATGKWGITGDSNGESLNVIHSEMTVQGSSGAICDFDGGIRIEDCSISSPAGGSVLGGYIVDSRATTATFVTITTLVTYPLNVTGVAVTSENADDILGDGIFSYDAATRTLTVSGDCTFTTSPIIDSRINGLIIYVAEDSTLTRSSHGTCIRLDGDTVITGPGRLTVNSDNTAISVWVSYDLEIRNTELVANGKTGGISHFDSEDSWVGKLIIRDSDVTVTSEENTIYDFRDGIELYDCEIVTPADYKIIDGTVFQADGVTQPKTVKIKGDSNREYDLWVAGTRVAKKNCANILAGTAGDGVFSYEPETNTLTVKGNYTASGSVINSSISGLTINAAGSSTLRSETGTAIRLYGDTTVTGPGALKLTASACGIYLTGGGTLTIENASVSAEGKWGVSGEGEGESLKVIGSVLTAKGTTWAIGDFTGGIALERCGVAVPAGGVVSDGAICESDGSTPAKEATIRPAEYDLFIAGTKVTECNAEDVLGDGIFSYHPAKSTLTISGDCSCSALVINSRIQGLTINVVRDAALHSITNGALMLYGDTTITGTGKLTLIASGGDCCGIFVTNAATLAIVGTNVLAEGDYGIAGYPHGESLVINGSGVTAKGATAAICDFDGGITLTDCTITIPENAVIQDGAICESGGPQAKEANILATGGALISEDDRKVTYEIDRSTGDVTIKGSVSAAEPVIVAAYTAEGMLLNIQLLEIEGEADAVIPDGAAKVELFWVNQDNMQPLCQNAVVYY